MSIAPKKLAILVGGGPAPGINSVIGAATIRAEIEGVEILGIKDGFKWVMEGEGAKKVVMIFRGMQKDEKDFERKPPPGVSAKRGGGRYGEEQ